MANQHIVPHGNEWQVKRENSSRATKNFSRQSDAIDYGREIARNQHSELVIHNRNGQIRDKDSYGNDPFPPRDSIH